MLKRLPLFAGRTVRPGNLVFLLLVIAHLQVNAQCTLNNLDLVTFPPVSGTSFRFTGYLRHLPADYATATTQKYPLMIFLGGQGSQGNGGSAEICRLLTDQPDNPAGYINNGTWNGTGTANGETFSYIMLAVQYNYWDRPFGFGQKIDDLITYAINTYRVDTSRIYLTGMSSGANLVMDYIGGSDAWPRRLAAAAVSSVCHDSLVTRGGPERIAAADLPIYFVHCTVDESCPVQIADDWTAAINAINPDIVRYTRLVPRSGGNPPFDGLKWCQGWGHATWPVLYTTSESAANAWPPNMYNWFAAQARTITLPVTLRDFSARLVNDRVQLEWITAQEINNKQFTIERAGADRQFQPIGTVAGAGNSTTTKAYRFTDPSPLANLSYYRLVQTDLDGKEQRFDIRYIVNRSGASSLIAIAGNPFNTSLQAYISLDKPQQVTITLTDVNGKVLLNRQTRYAQGATALELPTARLPRGVYLLRAAGESLSEVHKVVKE
ncbi:MAG: T9SS type A sorting domain-containing protein [Candidatus Pseudobacter hemicellulosilyticus]|uniref:T9SS type A sorting domain-containing protein n=1 Tax=Candidatus Pseudobacter hemicellulosilyticus TaxID=3121375 RepID=A0AAJ5WUM7_9BACT|nr:MAG: T9SS type A sorting domain-containing protein [Pseudobacter sp.]